MPSPSLQPLLGPVMKIFENTRDFSKCANRLLDLAIDPLIEEATVNGITTEDMNVLVKTFTKCNITALRATVIQKIVRCFVPLTTPSPYFVKTLMAWLIINMDDIPTSAAKTLFALFIALLENDLVDAASLRWSYEFLFRAMSRQNLEIVICKLLELLTMPDLITRFRTERLLSLQRKENKKLFFPLLSLYKTLRPDKVPEHIPVLSSSQVSLSVERNMMNAIARARARHVAMLKNPNADEVSRNFQNSGLSWSRNIPVKRNRRHNNAKMIPTLTFNTVSSLSEHNKLHPTKMIVEYHNIQELGMYIITCQSPAQVLALLQSTTGIFYLQFAGGTVQQRFRHSLYHTLTNVLESRDRKDQQLLPAILELLEAIEKLQETHLCGSAVVTRFVSQFLRLHGDEQLLPIVLRLMTRPVFSSYDELHTSILLALEQTFLSSDLNTRLLILTAVGDLILNLHWYSYLTPENDLDWNPETTLHEIGLFYAHLCCIAVVSDSMNNLVCVISEALQFYHLLLDIQIKACKLNLWTVPPATLMLACVLSSQDFLIESACDLLLRHRGELNLIHQYKNRLFKNQIAHINVIAINYTQIFINSGDFLDPALNSCTLFQNLSQACIGKVRKIIQDSENLNLLSHPAYIPIHYFLQKTHNCIFDSETMEESCVAHIPKTITLIKLLRGDSEEDHQE